MILFYIVLFFTIFAGAEYWSRRPSLSVPQFAKITTAENAIISAIITLLSYTLINLF